MKNIWLHSIVIVVLGGVLLAAAKVSVSPALNFLSVGFKDPAAAAAALSAPATAFALLAPALFLGWFTRRHPLLVGAAAGAIAILLAHQFASIHSKSFSLAGDMSACAMYAAVAALAGRALRYRFRPQEKLSQAT